MKQFIVLILSQFFILNLSAQERPLPIEMVKPKIDSVQKEVNRLYFFSETKRVCLSKIKERIHFKESITYQIKDTTYTILLDSNEQKLLICFHKNNLENITHKKPNSILLSEEEVNFKKYRDSAINKTKEAKYDIKIPANCAPEYLFHSNNNGYTLYITTVPQIDSIFPFGNDYQFMFDKQMKLLSFKKISDYKKKSIMKKDNPPGSTLLGVTAPNIPKNNFKILIPYYYKFRKFHHNLRLERLNSAINKRSISYNAINNEINVDLFPYEKKKY